MHEALKLSIVWSTRGGRSSDGAIVRKYRQYVRRAKMLNFESVEDRFARDLAFRDSMIANGWRWATIGRIDKDAQEELTPGHRTREQRKKTGGYVYRNVDYVEEGETFMYASKFDFARDTTAMYWNKFNSQWRMWAKQEWKTEPIGAKAMKAGTQAPAGAAVVGASDGAHHRRRGISVEDERCESTCRLSPTRRRCERMVYFAIWLDEHWCVLIHDRVPQSALVAGGVVYNRRTPTIA